MFGRKKIDKYLVFKENELEVYYSNGNGYHIKCHDCIGDETIYGNDVQECLMQWDKRRCDYLESRKGFTTTISYTPVTSVFVQCKLEEMVEL